MAVGQFCFISDDYFEKYDKEKKLLQNKSIEGEEAKGGRPCYVVFDGSKRNGIHWVVPISSKVDKYWKIRDVKVQKLVDRGVKNPVCREFVFGKADGVARAFLIANMFPVTDKYITNVYVNKAGNDVSVDEKAAKYIKADAKATLKKYNKNGSGLFADVASIQKGLQAELAAERKAAKQTASKGVRKSRRKAAARCGKAAPQNKNPNGKSSSKTMANYKAQIEAQRKAAGDKAVNTKTQTKTKSKTTPDRE